MYETYVLQRLLEELELAQASHDPVERSVHERACRHFGEMLHALRVGGNARAIDAGN